VTFFLKFFDEFGRVDDIAIIFTLKVLSITAEIFCKLSFFSCVLVFGSFDHLVLSVSNSSKLSVVTNHTFLARYLLRLRWDMQKLVDAESVRSS
jgi:hypothetical protein